MNEYERSDYIKAPKIESQLTEFSWTLGFIIIDKVTQHRKLVSRCSGINANWRYNKYYHKFSRGEKDKSDKYNRVEIKMNENG